MDYINLTGEITKETILDDYHPEIKKFSSKLIKSLAIKFREIIKEIGEDPDRQGLLKSPERIAKAFLFFTHGYNINPDEVLRSSMFKENSHQMIIVKDIEIYSLCEHHLVPFIGKAHIGYIPNGYVVGLSKIARVVEAYARRLQVQERLTAQIKDCIQNTLYPLGVGVVIEANHLCIQMRGVQKQNSITVTSDYTGVFLQDKIRTEFLSLIASKLH